MSENPVVYKFQLNTTENPLALMMRYRPNGHIVLNRNEWRGRKPRSCGITHVGFESTGDGGIKSVEIEVTYRPDDFVSYVGSTKYVGWNLHVLDKKQDGTLLDGKGQPLPEGESPVHLVYEVYKDLDYADLDFGRLVSENEVQPKRKRTFDEVMAIVHESSHVSMSVHGSFIAQRRHRPSVKVILSSSPAGTGIDGFGTKIIIINKFTPHLTDAILNRMTELVSDFVEGRSSIKNISTAEMVYVDLDDAFVDCTPNEEGKESRFNCLAEFLPEKFMEELAERLMSTYKIEVELVEDKVCALILRHEKEG